MFVDKKSLPLWKRLVLRIFGSIFGGVFACMMRQKLLKGRKSKALAGHSFSHSPA
jgi:hypothetical protein